MIREYTCVCGAEIIANDAEHSVAHTWPECTWFLERLAEAGESGTDQKLKVRDASGRLVDPPSKA
jgi:hypothetical protein